VSNQNNQEVINYKHSPAMVQEYYETQPLALPVFGS